MREQHQLTCLASATHAAYVLSDKMLYGGGMHVLISGANGHIGRCLMQGLPASWHRTGIDHTASQDPRIIQAELNDIASLGMNPKNFDVAIHLAANPDEEQPLAAHIDSNVIGCEKFLRWCAAGGIKRILFASSCEAFMGHMREQTQIPLNADYAPRNAYGCTKVFGEMVCRMLSHEYGVDTLAIRLGAMLPPSMDTALANDAAYQAIRLPEQELIETMISCIEGPWSGAQHIFLGPRSSSVLPTASSLQQLLQHG